MNGPAEWTALASLGPRQIFLVLVVALVLYGRSGVLRSRSLRWLQPWTDDPRQKATGPETSGKPAMGWTSADRAYWFLVIVAATAVAAWIVTRTLILGASGASH